MVIFLGKKYGKWETIKSLSEGGQGHIFLVKNTEETDSKEYVLKRLKHKEKRINKFKKEIEAGLTLKHHYIVKIESYDINHAKPYLVTDYYSKGDLSKFNLSSYSLEDKLKFFQKICKAINYAHEKGVIHRDIKPSNIFIKDDFEPMVGDFGLCYIEESERDTDTGEAIGSRYYMAPELADGKLDEINPLSDIYSLGKLLYFILTGQIFDREKHNASKFNITNYKGILHPNHKETLTLINDIFDITIVENPKHRLNNIDQLIKKIEEICLIEKISYETILKFLKSKNNKNIEESKWNYEINNIINDFTDVPTSYGYDTASNVIDRLQPYIKYISLKQTKKIIRYSRINNQISGCHKCRKLIETLKIKYEDELDEDKTL